MARFWIPWQPDHPVEGEEGLPAWAIAQLPDDAGAFVLTGDPGHPVRVDGKDHKGSVVARVLLVGDRQNETWVLQSSAREGLRVNGLPLVAGIRVLEDLDELRIGGTERIYFSTERTARVEPFPDQEGDTLCARCRAVITEGEPSVLCPGCSSWCHQTEDLRCWEYAAKCALCDQLTCLDTGFRWTPDNL